jgi:hypothetical protein
LLMVTNEVAVVGDVARSAVEDTPVPLKVTVAPMTRFVPVNVIRKPKPPRLWLTGERAVNVGVDGVATTVNAAVLVADPPAVVTVTLRALSVAPLVITKLAVIVVLFTTVTPEVNTPVPEIAIVLPKVKFVPVSVTATIAPRAPLFGEIDVSVGAGGATIVNGTAFELVPSDVTVTLRTPSVAVEDMVSVAVTLVPSVAGVTPETVTPPPDTLIEVTGLSPVPARVTATAVPRAPLLGEIEVSFGAGGAVTVKFTVPVVPPAVLTCTGRVVCTAFTAIAKFAESVPSAFSVTPVAVTPPPLMITCEFRRKLVPVRVTETVDPIAPALGLMPVSVGAGAECSTAPMVAAAVERV